MAANTLASRRIPCSAYTGRMNAMRVFVLLLGLLLAACAKPVPPPKDTYVGDWRAQNMTLQISAEGYVSYERREGNNTTTINAPIQSVDGDDFIVGVGPFKTKFAVSKPPHLEGNVWKMTVDGVELSRGIPPGDRSA